VKLFSLKNFILSLNEAPKAHYFCFLLLIQSSAVQQKSNKTTLPNSKTFSPLKLALCVQSLCLLLHNNFLVFNISDHCWKSSHNLWTLPNHKSRVTWGFRFPSMLQCVHSISYPGAARLDGLQPSLKNVRQKIPPNGQTRLKFRFSYENFTTQSFSVLPTPFWLNVS